MNLEIRVVSVRPKLFFPFFHIVHSSKSYSHYLPIEFFSINIPFGSGVWHWVGSKSQPGL